MAAKAIDSVYLVFEIDPPRKGFVTCTTWVRSRRGGDILGHISWHSPWRQYTFLPAPGCIFNVGCMRDIIAQIEALHEDRKRTKGAGYLRSTAGMDA